MKKLLVILLTLLMIFALPMAVMAEDVTETPAETTEGTSEETNEETSEALTEEATSETEHVDEPKTNYGFFPKTLAETLPIMGMGMLGIFLVTCVIILAVLILSKFGGKQEE